MDGKRMMVTGAGAGIGRGLAMSVTKTKLFIFPSRNDVDGSASRHLLGMGAEVWAVSRTQANLDSLKVCPACPACHLASSGHRMLTRGSHANDQMVPAPLLQAACSSDKLHTVTVDLTDWKATRWVSIAHWPSIFFEQLDTN